MNTRVALQVHAHAQYAHRCKLSHARVRRTQTVLLTRKDVPQRASIDTTQRQIMPFVFYIRTPTHISTPPQKWEKAGMGKGHQPFFLFFASSSLQPVPEPSTHQRLPPSFSLPPSNFKFVTLQYDVSAIMFNTRLKPPSSPPSLAPHPHRGRGSTDFILAHSFIQSSSFRLLLPFGSVPAASLATCPHVPFELHR